MCEVPSQHCWNGALSRTLTGTHPPALHGTASIRWSALARGASPPRRWERLPGRVSHDIRTGQVRARISESVWCPRMDGRWTVGRRTRWGPLPFGRPPSQRGDPPPRPRVGGHCPGECPNSDRVLAVCPAHLRTTTVPHLLCGRLLKAGDPLRAYQIKPNVRSTKSTLLERSAQPNTHRNASSSTSRDRLHSVVRPRAGGLPTQKMGKTARKSVP